MNPEEDNTSILHPQANIVTQKRNMENIIHPIPCLRNIRKPIFHRKDYDTSNKHLNVTFPKEPQLEINTNELGIPYCKDKAIDSKLKQILKLIRTAAIGLIGNS